MAPDDVRWSEWRRVVVLRAGALAVRLVDDAVATEALTANSPMTTSRTPDRRRCRIVTS
jgi:hypothetical protein